MVTKDDALFYVDNPVIAHATFFAVAHGDDPAPFHSKIIEDWHSPAQNILTLAFRGSGKSTLAEEAITLQACMGLVRNVLILKESEARAADSLKVIKHFLEYDDALQDTFQIGPGEIWTETRALTSTGVMIQAYGRGQSLRGVKYLNNRPDFIFLDDVEDKESGSVSTPEARAKTKNWLAGTVIPTLAPGGRMRMAATPLHPEALAPTLARADRSWISRTYPIVYRSNTGAWTPAWPNRFPLPVILKIRNAYEEIGELDTFSQEYMCESVNPASQTFTADMFQIAGVTPSCPPVVRAPHHPVYAVYDPARTTHKQSATTGKAVASWINNRLIVWESTAQRWMPDEIVNDIFITSARYQPVAVGVEENGLNEWLLQPIRTQQLIRGEIIPLRPLRAPRGKLDFIRGLQPYFASRSVIFAEPLPELASQLVGFPSGHIDAPNALAYLLVMKLGLPIYDNFTDAHVNDPRSEPGASPLWLLVNSSNRTTTAILASHAAGRLSVHWDAVADGDPGTVLTDLVEEAMLASPGPVGRGPPLTRTQPGSRRLRLLAAPRHFDEYTIYGLRAAARALAPSAILERGGDPALGREEIRKLLRRLAHGGPAFTVSPAASWTLRALAGGYARDASAVLPIDNAYATLIEPLESFAARLGRADADLAAALPVAYTGDGRRYLTAMAHQPPVVAGGKPQ